MSKETELYKLWCEKAVDDPDLQTELKSIEGDDEAVLDRFYRDLEFGTGGLRGVIGAGAYRLNIYTIRRATQGLADYVNATFKNAKVAISYDSRIKSDVFAKATAAVMAANGIKAYIYKELMPTPCLSWAVRELGCQAGVMVTASHNPAKYNGYKVYGEDGCQLTIDAANVVTEKIEAVDMFGGAKYIDFEEGLKSGMIEYIGQDVIDKYLDKVAEQGIHTDLVADSGLKVVYTPLNGTGNKPVRAILKKIGIKEVTVVPEQENPDGNFPTCPFPNPEIKEALAKGLELCKSVKPDLLLATDPDCDRVGIAVPAPDGSYVLFSGNEVGAMLLKYVCQERTALGTMPKDPVAVKTIVTTDICRKIADEYGVELRNVLTGFKFIGEQIGFLEKDDQADRYIFGFEESYGYLAGSYVRDKDAVVASMLICEMAAFYRTKGITLLQAREELYKQYGNYLHSQESFQCEGASGMEKMKEIMADLRTNGPKEIGGLKVTVFADYKTSEQTDIATGKKTVLTLPKSDVLVFELEQGASVVIRPSGTEPKIKAYYTAIGDTRADAEKTEAALKADFKKILGF
ncbi:phospho-sugar mutase [Ruminococcus albus]|uniref:Phosphoglucomutase n=1 Tax=Ruminococcus albus (strain ATCC 27210 / DSM 20455 / JCM 14654 / NCDO 2250 / 7) TaxID=697329 RepID=E6UJ42_RUMA7|nr:phospho-sugar mutase [Ruminococcus albus]ADU23390.1 phosphoglucomutase/phosphomannomutase alpha/beta/alpha domain I [Ruminococcus albus 7 = DSM 20455]